jgi:proline iminopeptidase
MGKNHYEDILFPAIEPYRTGRLQVSPLHDLYYEEVGNPRGKPAVYLHGGPGGGLSATHRRFHDPEKYRLILFDQRGSGQSTPAASLEDNTTWDLVSDIEKLRIHLGVERWQVFGGSWGSTLGLAYAQTHPERVTELLLRGIFLTTRPELDWFYGGKGADFLHPELWSEFQSLIPAEERGDMIAAYYRRLTSSDLKIRARAAYLWSLWEYSLVTLLPDPSYIEQAHDTAQAEKIARIECHYFVNGSFFKTPNWLIENASRIKDIPGLIVHGRYDLVCPPAFAWQLHQAWPKADFHMIPDAGHAATEPGIARTLVDATHRFA